VIFAVNHYLKGRIKPDVPQKAVFIYDLLFIKIINIIITFIDIRVDGEIAHTERGKILEKMSSLAGIYSIVLKSRFNNHSGS